MELSFSGESLWRIEIAERDVTELLMVTYVETPTAEVVHAIETVMTDASYVFPIASLNCNAHCFQLMLSICLFLALIEELGFVVCCSVQYLFGINHTAASRGSPLHGLRGGIEVYGE
jgi:hypothetical protein